MHRTRLRTRFLLSMVLITAGLTALSLLVVQHSMQSHVREGIVQDLGNSVTTFQNFQHDREVMLTRSAELVADLPITRAIMTAPDPGHHPGCIAGRVAVDGQRSSGAGQPQ